MPKKSKKFIFAQLYTKDKHFEQKFEIKNIFYQECPNALDEVIVLGTNQGLCIVIIKIDIYRQKFGYKAYSLKDFNKLEF